MKLKTDVPRGLTNDFICMGIVTDSDKDYACLLLTADKPECKMNKGQMFIEEIHYGHGKNLSTATLHQIDNDTEWEYLFKMISALTTIFSPKKVNQILKNPSVYFYTSKYKKSEDYQNRKKQNL